nr:MAG TPA: hypothetical protein [Microviridae sp.]
MKENKTFKKFGPGYRTFDSVREIQLCPVCASSESDIAVEELPTEQFRFERCGAPDDPEVLIRIRSDISMLLHAADMSKKYGKDFVQSMIDLRRPKSSALQEVMDNMSDAQILDTVKSRHLQSPSELIAWSEYLTEQAKSIEQEAERIALEKQIAEESASIETQSASIESQTE